MANSISSTSLCGLWEASFTEDRPDLFLEFQKPSVCWLEAQVPEPAHQTAQRAGLIEDLNVGLNALKARWVEEQWWIYRREFEVSSDMLGGGLRLVFDLLEFHAKVYVNGRLAGEHFNAHRPATFDITGLIREGTNWIVAVLESGIRWAADKPSAGYLPDATHPTRRHHLRKPQYQAGWDWSPWLMNVGILGDVRLEWGAFFADDWSCSGKVSPNLDCIELELACVIDNPSQSELRVNLEAEIVSPSGSVDWLATEVTVPPGHQPVAWKTELPNPELWHPIGVGPQNLYKVRLAATSDTGRIEKRFHAGFRRVEIDQSPHPDGGRFFILKVNNRPVFCKGGNLVPADMLYTTVSRERWERLADFAVDLNMNLLRLWGGGHYIASEIIEACDRIGLMVWHDFAYACAKYEMGDETFAREALIEAEHQTRRLSRHPSLVVWCGNNEVLWGDADWDFGGGPVKPHGDLFEVKLAAIVERLSPHTPYWPGSPWSPDGLPPNESSAGDQHPWNVSLGEHGPDWRHYRAYADRFPNEGGVLGCSGLKTLREMLPEGERRLFSPSWRFHDNLFAWVGTKPGALGRAYETVRFWTGLELESLPLERYALLSAALQAEGLHEYIRNYRRRMFDSAAAIFWMFNDSWPATHGWTTQDYYLRKKLCYYPVRRAFEAATVALAHVGTNIAVYGVNDTDRPVSARLALGPFALDESPWDPVESEAELAPNASTKLAEVPVSEAFPDPAAWGFAAKLELADGSIRRDRLFLETFANLRLRRPRISVSVSGGKATFLSDAFAWAVCLDVEGEADLEDNCFDLLPGVPYSIAWPNDEPPKVVWCGSEALMATS